MPRSGVAWGVSHQILALVDGRFEGGDGRALSRLQVLWATSSESYKAEFGNLRVCLDLQDKANLALDVESLAESFR